MPVEAYIISFFGMQPLMTQVPPNLSPSISATLAPYSEALLAQAMPPDPPPITTKSKFNFIFMLSRRLRYIYR